MYCQLESVCPDYEIVEWNEDNFDVTQNGYTRWCYENRKFAFLSDYVRLAVVAEHGGLYFDTWWSCCAVRTFSWITMQFFGFEIREYVASGLGLARRRMGA